MPADFFAVRDGSTWDQPENVTATQLRACPNVAYKRILVPLDFSESSRSALGHAVSLALHFHAEIVLLHVFEPVTPELKILESVFADPNFHDQAAHELKEWHKLVPQGLAAKAVFREARTAQRGILNAAAELDTDLIVMGRHPRKGLERLYGSTTEHVLKHAQCAVLVTAPEEAATPKQESCACRFPTTT